MNIMRKADGIRFRISFAIEMAEFREGFVSRVLDIVFKRFIREVKKCRIQNTDWR